jgi:membrane protein DedA with SNARE-associated domain
VEDFLDQYGYLALMVGTFLEGETAILVASSLIHRGMFDTMPTILIAFLGSFISDWLYYLIGRLNGKLFVDKRPSLKAKVEPVTLFFQKNKLQILFTYRFLYGFRVIIPIIIGMSNIRPLQFLKYSVLAGLLWATTVSTIGYFAGRILNVSVLVFEKNLPFIMIGFACFGLLIGYTVKRLTFGKTSL